MEQAQQPGLAVEECVRRLKRYHYAFKRLHQIFTARITAEPIYELKMGFSLHAHLCAEHTSALRQRVGEMREPPLGLEAVPDPTMIEIRNLAPAFVHQDRPRPRQVDWFCCDDLLWLRRYRNLSLGTMSAYGS